MVCLVVLLSTFVSGLKVKDESDDPDPVTGYDNCMMTCDDIYEKCKQDRAGSVKQLFDCPLERTKCQSGPDGCVKKLKIKNL